jgi:omega-amidase
MCSPARDMSAGYHAWGHSMVVDPNGEVVSQTGAQEDIVYADLSNLHEELWVMVEPERMEEVRRNIPVTTQRR